MWAEAVSSGFVGNVKTEEMHLLWSFCLPVGALQLELELHKGLSENGKWRQRLAESHKSLWKGWGVMERQGRESERAYFIQHGESIEDLTRKGPRPSPHNFTLNYTRFVCARVCGSV